MALDQTGCAVSPKASDNSKITPVVCRLSLASSGDLAAIDAESNRPPWSEQLFASEFEMEHSRVYGARVHGILAAFLVVHVVLDEAHIVSFGVRENWRRRGIGTELLVDVLQQLYMDNVQWVTLEVRRSNSAARKLYESFGFYETGVRTAYYSDDSEDAVVLSLSLVHFIDECKRGKRAALVLRSSFQDPPN